MLKERRSGRPKKDMIEWYKVYVVISDSDMGDWVNGSGGLERPTSYIVRREGKENK